MVISKKSVHPKKGIPKVATIMALCGKSSKDPEVIEFLKSLGFQKSPKCPSGEYNAYVGFKQLGLCLLFEDEAMLKQEDKPLGKSPLILIGCFFYAAGEERYKEYAGIFPENIKFSDSIKEIADKLGTPEFVREKNSVIRGERWKISGKIPYVGFSNIVYISFSEQGKIKNIYYGFFEC